MEFNDVVIEIIKAIIKMIFNEFQRYMDRESLDKEVEGDDESVKS